MIGNEIIFVRVKHKAVEDYLIPLGDKVVSELEGDLSQFWPEAEETFCVVVSIVAQAQLP